MENKWSFIYFLAIEKLTLGMRYSRYLVINVRSRQISCHKYKIPSININQWDYAMWHWKRTWEPLQISINRGSQPKKKRKGGFLEIQFFFKTSSSSKEALSLSLFKQGRSLSKSSQASIYAWSLKRTKLCWIKSKRSIRVLQQHFEDKSRYSLKHQITISRFAIHVQIRVLAKHKSWLDYSNKSSHHTSNSREESEDCHILLKEYIT